MKTIAIFILGLLMISCSDNKDEVSLNKCSESTLIQELTENTPVIVKSVEDGEPFYDGSKIYYEVDAETYLPKIFEQNQNKYIRLFPINKTNHDIGTETTVKGTITTCVTGNHGLLTNNYIAFYLLEQ